MLQISQCSTGNLLKKVIIKYYYYYIPSVLEYELKKHEVQ